MGSGTTALSAKKLKRDFIGIDIAKEYCKISQERLEGFEKTGIDPFQEMKNSKKLEIQLHSNTLPLFQEVDW